MFKLRMETKNAAFDNEEDYLKKHYEVARILKEVVMKLENGDEWGTIHDINGGNKIGEWTLTNR